LDNTIAPLSAQPTTGQHDRPARYGTVEQEGHTMEQEISTRRMAHLVLAQLYHIKGDRATPNYRYCREDAPVYDFDRRRQVWCKLPSSGGKMKPIVEAANGTR